MKKSICILLIAVACLLCLTGAAAADYVKFSKYNTSSSYGPIDNNTTLDLEDDVAHVKWGGSWRMPTKAEQDELRSNCTWTWTTMNGINGYLVTSNREGYTDRSIFLPAAGYRGDSLLSDVGSLGYYWSSSLYTDYLRKAWYVYFYSDGVFYGVSDGVEANYSNRSEGSSVRPVCP